jgi:hypothetical protein
MSKLEGIAVIAIIEALEKIGETFLDGDRSDDFRDVINSLLGIFGLGSDEKKCDEGER